MNVIQYCVGLPTTKEHFFHFLENLRNQIYKSRGQGNFIPVHVVKVYVGKRSTAPLIPNLDTSWKSVVKFTHRPLYRQWNGSTTRSMRGLTDLRPGEHVEENWIIFYSCRETIPIP
jgi:hypothetical protein